MSLNRNFITILVVLAVLLGAGVALGADGMVLAMVGLVAVACVIEGFTVAAAARYDALR